MASTQETAAVTPSSSAAPVSLSLTSHQGGGPSGLVLSKLGHELRAPLAAVRGLAKVMRTRLDNGSADPAQQRRHLELIDESAATMLETVDRVVAVAKLDTAPPAAPRQFDCRAVVDRVAEGARARAGLHDRLLVVEVPDQPVAVSGDDEALGRVLTELVDNALKYSDQPQIRLTLRTLPPRQPVIEVADDGPGMSAEELQAVCAPFARGQAAERGGIPGSGLGLYLARELASRSDIGMDVSTAPGAGTTFAVRPGR